MKYRPDIDGLRAIAVLSVLFYHLGFTNIVASGFIGVDIFFVISGFLITGIIYKEITCKAPNPQEREYVCASGTFSFLNFYERRIRRIFPIFLFVILITLVFAHYINFYDMRNFLNSLFSSLIMGSNFYFWKDTGYFALPSDMKLLLHTWSLGVEEQFYIIFPPLLILLLSKKFSIVFTSPHGTQFELTKLLKKVSILQSLSFLWLVSFIICIIQSQSTSDTAFYLLPYRFWELLTGSILAIYTLQNKTFCKTERQANLFGLLGLTLIIGSVLFLQHIKQPFPSFLPIFACIGTVFCIEAGRFQYTITYKILSFSLLKYIGKISFSLYLWHWVIIVFAREIVLCYTISLSFSTKVYCFIISIVLSILSYLIIEQPIRKKKILKTRRQLFTTMFVAMVSIAILAFAIKKDFIPKVSTSPDIAYYQSINSNNSYPQKLTRVTNDIKLFSFGTENVDPTIFVIGDSHSKMFYTTLDALAKEHGVAGLIYADSNTSLFYTYDSFFSSDTALNNTKYVQDYIRKYNFQSILISLRWTIALYGYDRNTKKILEPQSMQHYINPKTKEITTDSELAIRQGIASTLQFFKNTNANIFIKKPLPEFAWQIPQRAAQAVRFHSKESDSFRKLLSIPYSSYLDFHKETFVVLDSIAEEYNMEFIDFTKDLCDGEYCYGTAKDGTPYFVDDDHLSIQGVELLKEYLLPVILAGKKKTSD